MMMGYLIAVAWFILTNVFLLFSVVYYFRRSRGNEHLSNIKRVFDKPNILDDKTLLRKRLNLARIWGFIALFMSMFYLPLLGSEGLTFWFYLWFLGFNALLGYVFYNSWKEEGRLRKGEGSIS